MNRRTDFVKYGQKWLAITSIYYLCSSEHRAYSLQRTHTERQLQRSNLFTQSVVNLIHSLCVLLACSVVRWFSMSLKYTVQLTCNVGERRSVDISVSEKKRSNQTKYFQGGDVVVSMQFKDWPSTEQYEWGKRGKGRAKGTSQVPLIFFIIQLPKQNFFSFFSGNISYCL